MAVPTNCSQPRSNMSVGLNTIKATGKAIAIARMAKVPG